MANTEINIITRDQQRDDLEKILDQKLRPFYEELKKITEPEEILTRAEVKAILKISDTSLWHWERKGIIPGYGIQGKRFYKRSDIMAALIKIS